MSDHLKTVSEMKTKQHFYKCVYVLTEVCHFANNLGVMQIECGVRIIV